VTGKHQVTGGNRRNPSGKKKAGYPQDMEGFWLSDKFWVIADSNTLDILA
jgi:hypothetical protein